MQCPQCGHDVPALDFCVRCGFGLGGERDTVPERRSSRRRYAAAPHETAWVPHLASTLFPQLPRAEMRHFASTLALGVAVIVALAIAGLYPLALTIACVLIPLVVLLYLYAVDVYEDEPLLVVALTMAWGALAGGGLGVLVQKVKIPIEPPGFHLLGNSAVLVRVVGFPLAGLLLSLAGPVVLLRHPRFNDVLDGTTFGAATAVTLVGTQTLVQAWPLVSAGYRPPGSTGPWLLRLVEIGVLVPVIWAGAAGAVGAALWLRFRAHDHGALGALGSPRLALFVAAALIIGGPAGLQVLPRIEALIWLVALALVALIALRRAIHVGLAEEANEIEIGPEIICANCHRTTPHHTFCGRCGIALRALPKGARHREFSPTEPAESAS